jgi:hypothetical protein
MIMQINKINHKVLLIAIYLYLDSYFDQGIDELGDFLSSLSPIVYDDGLPADPALYEDWYEIINKQENLGKEEAYHYMFEFLKMQNDLGWPEIGQFIKKANLSISNKHINIQQFTRWNEAINKALEYNVKY